MTGIASSDGQFCLLVAASHTARFRPEWIDPSSAADAGLVTGAAGGRGNALFLDAQGEQLVLRHYCRGGMMGRVNHDRFLWLGAQRTRSFAEFRLLDKLHGMGLPVPLPVASRYRRKGLYYTADIVTRRIPAAVSWSQRLAAAPSSTPDGEWWRVGVCVRRFHDAGIYHADLNAHNIMIDDADRIYLIDFDRGAQRVPGRWQQTTLARLQRSLRKISGQAPCAFYTDTLWSELLAGYSA